jgi:HNH endonuclease
MLKVPTHRRARPPAQKADRHTDTQWRRFINGQPWRRLSKHHLYNHPACELCMQRDVLVAATVVHHTRGQDPEYAMDQDTLQSLCNSCHSRLHASKDATP